MFEFISYGTDKLQIFLLILLRAAGLFMLSPILSHPAVPKMVKAGLCILFTILMTTALPLAELPEMSSIIEMSGMALREILIGVLIGFMFQLMFNAVHAAGSLVGYQIGFAMAMVLDPTSKTQQSVMSQLWFAVAVLIFVATNSHHLIISAFANSFEVMPPGGAVLPAAAGELIIKYTFYVFVLALKLAAPIMVTLFLTDVALGVVAKMMPTMNIFIVGFPMKIGVGLLVLSMAMPIFTYGLEKATIYLDTQLHTLLSVMGKA